MRLFIFISIILVLYSCANVGRPSGGPVDKNVPILVRAFPDNESLNFKDKKIEIVFDENIQLQNVQQELIISPTIEKTPEIKAYKNKINIIINDSLSPNTTYVFNFGNAIIDYNESNKLSGFKYVISTGEKLDTVKQQIQITNAESKKPESGCIVALYKLFEIENKNLNPLYYARTDADGNANFTNLKPGNYDIIAFKDENGNLFPDVSSELISLIIKNQELNEINNENISIEVFQNESNKILKSAELINKRAVLIQKIIPNTNLQFAKIILNKKILTTEILSPTETIFWLENKDEKDIKVFSTIGEKIIDSIIPTIKSDRLNFEKSNKKSLNIIKKYQDYTLNKQGKCLSVMFSDAIQNIDKSKINLISEDKKVLKFDVSKDESNMRKINFFVDDISSNIIQIKLEKAAITNIWNEVNDSIQEKLNIQSPEKLADLSFVLKSLSPEVAYIFNLKNNSQETVQSIMKKGMEAKNILFEKIQPETYNLQIIEDINADGFWNSGNVFQNKLPEKIYWIRNVKARANWETEQEFDLKK